MLPTIKPGSLVITKKSPEYQIDDIVSFTQEEEGVKKIIVHRIIDETEKGFVIKGDNNQNKDPGYPTYADINGKVIFATPYFGDIMLLLKNPIFLFGASTAMALIQYLQKRAKKRKERLRRIRLGLPTRDISKPHKRPQKADYQPFLYAAVLNVVTYIIIQISIIYEVPAKGDVATGFLFRQFEPSFASTLAFGLYLLFILGLYFGAKLEEKKISKSMMVSRRRSKSLQLLIAKNFRPILSVSHFLLVLFVMMSIFHILSMGPELYDAITCDPTKELC